MNLSRFATYAWFVVGYNVLVVLWGAVVRATGSGAGCGNHWPQCNGEVLPRPETVEILIEFSHRLTSAFSGILVIILLVWAFRLQPVQKFIRRMAIMSFVFIIIEGLLGAALVRFEWVADDASPERALVVGVHLVNTLVLLGFMTLTAWAATRRKQKTQFRIVASSGWRWVWIVALVAMVLLSAAGAVTALGDTLFPSESPAQSIPDALDPTSHFLVQLRVWHPVIAVLTSVYLFVVGYRMQRRSNSEIVKDGVQRLFMLVGLQLGIGVMNILLLAPVWMQVIHLLVADLMWIQLVVLTADVFVMHGEAAAEREPDEPQLSMAT